MKTITLTVYPFSELDEKGKARAKQDHQSIWGYSWSKDALMSLAKLAQHFGGKLVNYEIDWFNCSPSFATFDMPDLTKQEIRGAISKLGSYNRRTGRGDGECVLTGYCGDEDAIDGLRAAFRRGVTDLPELMQAAFKTWLHASQVDCEGQYSDDQFGETCDSNGYLFFANGKIAPKSEA